jgi:hypothetical protein
MEEKPATSALRLPGLAGSGGFRFVQHKHNISQKGSLQMGNA